MRLSAVVPVVALSALLASGCTEDPQADYCEVVEEHQSELSEIVGSDDVGAIFGALDAYEDLEAEAPRDIADDWAAVVEPLRGLEQVLSDEGVDPSSYAADAPPADLDAEGRAAIEAAARAVGSEQTVAAMAAVEQHALDVCGTPLSR